MLLQDIEKALVLNENELSELNNEIKQIKKWIAELIHEFFHVPNEYWYEELSNYKKIIESKENSNIDKNKITGCNNLIKEYQSQIKFRETKIILNELNNSKLEKSKQAILKTDKKITHTKQNIVQKHQTRISELTNSVNILDDDYTHQKQLEDIIENVNVIIENNEIENEVQTFMKKLNDQFTTETKSYNQSRLIAEMEKLIKEYKSEI